jgi:hypothetical protein
MKKKHKNPLPAPQGRPPKDEQDKMQRVNVYLPPNIIQQFNSPSSKLIREALQIFFRWMKESSLFWIPGRDDLQSYLVGRTQTGLAIFPRKQNGWNQRAPYLGSLTDLAPAPLYLADGTGYTPTKERD